MTRPGHPRAPNRKLDTERAPTRKLSETLLDFAQLLVDAMPEDATARDLEKRLLVPMTIWNAMVMEELGMSGILARTHAQFRSSGLPLMVALFETLVERKRRDFADDHRLIGRHQVWRAADGSWKMRVETRSLELPAPHE